MSREWNSEWLQLKQSHAAYANHLRTFLSGNKEERIEFLREKYKSDRGLVITVLESLDTEDLKELLPFLVEHVRSVHAVLQHLRSVILLLPKPWLIDNIEAAVEPWLQTADEEYFRRFLELYYLIDRRLTRRLAERAARSDNGDIRDSGEDFLKKLEEDN